MTKRRAPSPFVSPTIQSESSPTPVIPHDAAIGKPVLTHSLLTVLASLEAIEEEFTPIADPAEPTWSIFERTGYRFA